VHTRLLAAAADGDSVVTVHLGAESEGCGGCAMFVVHKSQLPFTSLDARAEPQLAVSLIYGVLFWPILWALIARWRDGRSRSRAGGRKAARKQGSSR